MDEENIKEILNDPEKLLNLFRLCHQLLHLIDEKEFRKALEKKDGPKEQAGLGDTISIIAKDKEGNIKSKL